MSLLNAGLLLAAARKACADSAFLAAFMNAQAAAIAADNALDDGADLDSVRSMRAQITSFIVEPWATRALTAATASPPKLRADQLRAIGAAFTAAAAYLTDLASEGSLVDDRGVPVPRESVEAMAIATCRAIDRALAGCVSSDCVSSDN